MVDTHSVPNGKRAAFMSPCERVKVVISPSIQDGGRRRTLINRCAAFGIGFYDNGGGLGGPGDGCALLYESDCADGVF